MINDDTCDSDGARQLELEVTEGRDRPAGTATVTRRRGHSDWGHVHHPGHRRAGPGRACPK